jgi:hypothetical protein
MKVWNQQLQTGRVILNIKPDIIARDKKKGPCMFMDVAVSGGRNKIKKEAEKILKCKDVTVATQCLRSVKTNVISVIIAAVGTISD